MVSPIIVALVSCTIGLFAGYCLGYLHYRTFIKKLDDTAPYVQRETIETFIKWFRPINQGEDHGLDYWQETVDEYLSDNE